MNKKESKKILYVGLSLSILLLIFLMHNYNLFSIAIFPSYQPPNGQTQLYLITFNNVSNPASPISAKLQLKGNFVYGPYPPPNPADNHFFTENCTTTYQSVQVQSENTQSATYFSNPAGNTQGFTFLTTPISGNMQYNIVGDLCVLPINVPSTNYGESLMGNLSEVIGSNTFLLGSFNTGVGGSGQTGYSFIFIGISPKTDNMTTTTFTPTTNTTIVIVKNTTQSTTIPIANNTNTTTILNTTTTSTSNTTTSTSNASNNVFINFLNWINNFIAKWFQI